MPWSIPIPHIHHSTQIVNLYSITFTNKPFKISSIIEGILELFKRDQGILHLSRLGMYLKQMTHPAWGHRGVWLWCEVLHCGTVMPTTCHVYMITGATMWHLPCCKSLESLRFILCLTNGQKCDLISGKIERNCFVLS